MHQATSVNIGTICFTDVVFTLKNKIHTWCYKSPVRVDGGEFLPRQDAQKIAQILHIIINSEDVLFFV